MRRNGGRWGRGVTETEIKVETEVASEVGVGVAVRSPRERA
jgi:hypothetical protein